MEQTIYSRLILMDRQILKSSGRCLNTAMSMIFQIGYRKGRQDGGSRVFVTKTLRLVVWLMFHEWVTDANTPFRLMQKDRLKAIMEVIPKDYFLCNVAISAIAVKWNYKIKFYKITFKPRQGGVNSINMKRIFGIGWKALGDFRKINADLRKYKRWI